MLMLATVPALILGLGALAAVRLGFRFNGITEMDAALFPEVRAIAGLVVGGLMGAYVTISVIANLSHDRLKKAEGGGNAVAQASLWSSRNPKKVLVVVLLLTVLFGAGLEDVHTDVDVADVLPRGNQNTEAAHNLTDRFKSTYTQEMELQFEVNPEQCRRDSQRNLPMRPASDLDCGNITDEVYVRAIQEAYEFFQSYTHVEESDLPWEDDEEITSPIRYQISLPTFMKLLNWTLEGGQGEAPPDAFGLPGRDDRARWDTLQESGWQLLQDTQTPIMDPSHEQTVVLYMPTADEEMESQEIGRFMIEARDAYLEWAPENADWQVFTEDNPPLHTVDLPVANAHSSHLAEEDFALFLPLIALVLIVSLYALFREPRSVAIAGTSLSIAVVWTYGLMGHMDIAMNNLNLTVLPLIMGTGIDYSIHMINEFMEHKSQGASNDEAFEVAGQRAGVAMLIATLITVAGLTVMVLSPSLLLAQLGGLAMIAIVSVYLLTILFIPAILSMLPGTEDLGADYQPSSFVPALGRFVSKHKIVFGVLVLAITGLSLVGLQQLTVEEFGEPAQNWPEDDWLRQEHEEGLRGFYDVEGDAEIFKANAVVIEGDITDPAAHDYIDRLSASLQAEAQQSDVIDMHTSRDLPFIVRSWLKVCCGPQSLISGTLSENLEQEGYQEYSQYPQSRPAIENTLDDMFASPYATFSSLFVSYPNNDITIITVSVQTGDFQNAEEAWLAVTSAQDRAADAKPNDVTTSFVGNTPTNYLFSSEQLPWLNYMSIVAMLAAMLLVWAFTRDLKAVLAVTTVIGLTSLWVLGVLPSLGIGLAITLMLPLVFIFSIGSDYAVHMVWNLRQVGDAEKVYGTVGKAVLFSAITDIGAFAVMAPIPGTPLEGIRDLMVRDAIVATIVAIAIIFTATIVILSLFYDVAPAEEDEPEESPAVEPGPAAGA